MPIAHASALNALATTLAFALTPLLLSSCATGSGSGHPRAPRAPGAGAGARARTPPRQATSAGIYAATASNRLAAGAVGDPPLVYVPNSMSNTVDVIDQRRMRVIHHFGVGALPQHVTPAWNLRTLYVDNDLGNSLTPLDPRTGLPRGRAIPVRDPYNLYFTTDGSRAIVVAEALRRLDFRDAATMALRHSLPVPCAGVDHMDFSADGRYLFASCEFAGTMIKVDVARQRNVALLRLGHGAGSPQDVKLSPDGRVLYVADQVAGGLWEVSPSPLRVIGFLATGSGTHGLYPSRDGSLLYVSNRTDSSVSLVSFARRRVVGKWRLPHGSPDMGGVSADGRVLWLSGRYNAEVYAIDTRTGRLRARIPVGKGPHGLSVWPQPGRYSLGHTGNMR